MNNEIDLKKEYVKPEMSVIDYEHQGALLCESGSGDDCVNVEFLEN